MEAVERMCVYCAGVITDDTVCHGECQGERKRMVEDSCELQKGKLMFFCMHVCKVKSVCIVS